MRLAGMKSVVTGGASGIGAATARRFAAEGAQVCILDRGVRILKWLNAMTGISIPPLESRQGDHRSITSSSDNAASAEQARESLSMWMSDLAVKPELRECWRGVSYRFQGP